MAALVDIDLDLADDGVDVYARMSEIRSQTPLGWCPAFGGWLASSAALADEILMTPSVYVNANPDGLTYRTFGPQMLSADGAEHEHHRKPFDGHLRLRPVREGYTQLILEEIGVALDRIGERKRFDLAASFASPLAASVISRVIGFDADTAARIPAWYESFVAANANYAGVDAVQRRLEETRAEVRAAIYDTLASRRDDASTPSLLGAARASAADSFSDEDLVGNVMLLIFGGTETVAATILNTMVGLLRHPAALAATRREPDELIAKAIDEALRWEPPAPLVDRWAAVDTELGGIEVRKGDLVVVHLGAANRDPDAFADGDSYELGRDARRALSFGRGVHMCIGFNLARLEARLAIAELLERFPTLSLDASAEPSIRGWVFRRPPELRVVAA